MVDSKSFLNRTSFLTDGIDQSVSDFSVHVVSLFVIVTDVEYTFNHVDFGGGGVLADKSAEIVD